MDYALLDAALISGLALIHVILWCTVIGNLAYLYRHSPSSLPSSPSVSILIPARNEAKNLQRLLPSLLQQSYPNWEVIVYDDGSTDDTWSVLQSFDSNRIRAIRGDGPPPGWVGKVHALYQATRHASGDYYLFLDADAELSDEDALTRLLQQYVGLPDDSVLTGLTQLRSGGQLLTSLVPNVILTSLPWPVSRWIPLNAVGALNGQCWMVDADTYHDLEPHEHHADKVLEDVEIGRYFKEHDIIPELVDVQDEVHIHMYDDFFEAWEGFRKNAYLIMGGHPLPFALFFVLFALTFVLAPFVSFGFLLSIYGLKLTTDRAARFSPGITLLAPLSYVLASALQFDSALHHWRDRVAWKGRRVSTS